MFGKFQEFQLNTTGCIIYTAGKGRSNYVHFILDCWSLNRLENPPCNAPNMDEYIQRWSADGGTSFRVCMWVRMLLSSWLKRNCMFLMNKKTFSLQFGVQVGHQCRQINSKCQICHPVLFWELWDVFAFRLTNLSDLCFQVPNSLEDFAQAESSDSCVVADVTAQPHAPPKVRQSVCDSMNGLKKL